MTTFVCTRCGKTSDASELNNLQCACGGNVREVAPAKFECHGQVFAWPEAQRLAGELQATYLESGLTFHATPSSGYGSACVQVYNEQGFVGCV